MRLLSPNVVGIALALAGGFGGLALAQDRAAGGAAPTELSFQADVLPIFRGKCLACHNATEAQGELILETPQQILKGGSTGPAVIAGKSGESLLMMLVTRQKEPHMPPPDNDVKASPLSPAEVETVRRWIDQGAKAGPERAREKLVWRALPATIQPIYSVAITSDGQFAAATRGNQVHVYHLPSKREMGTLRDSNVSIGGAGSQQGGADFDLVQSLRFSPDGSTLASGGFRTVKLWARPAPAKTQEFAFAGSGTRPLAASADGTLIAVAYENGKLQSYATATGQKVEAEVGDGALKAAAYSPDGKHLFVSDGGRVQVRAVADLSLVAAGETPSPICSLVVATDGRVVTGHEDGMLRSWDIPADASAWPMQPAAAWKAHSGEVLCLVNVAHGEGNVLSGGADGAVRLWERAGDKPHKEWKLEGPAVGVAAAPGGKLVAALGSKSGKLWNVESGQPVAELKCDLEMRLAIEKLERALSLAKKHVELAKKDLEDAKKLQQAEEENQKKAKEALTKAENDLKPKVEAAQKAGQEKEATDKALAAAQGEKEKAEKAKQEADEAAAKVNEALASAKSAADQGGKLEGEPAQKVAADVQKVVVALAPLPASLATWQLATKSGLDAAQKSFTEAEKKQQEAAAKLQKATDEKAAGEKLVETAKRGVERAASAVAKATGALPGFEAAVTKATEAATRQEEALASAKQAAEKKAGDLQSVTFSADGQTIYAAEKNGRCYSWDVATGATLSAFDGGQQAGLVASSASGTLMTAGPAGAAAWNCTPAWKLTRTIGDPDDPGVLVDRVTALDFSPDGKLLAAGSGEASRSGQIKLFDPRDGKPIRAITDPHSDVVNSLAFSPDGKQLASGGADRFAKLWQVADGKLLRALEGHTHHVLGVAWRADGRAVATCGADTVLKIWDARTGEQSRTIQNQFTKEISSVTFLADGDLIVASGGDARLRILSAANGNQQRDLTGASDYLYSVAARADGKTIVAGGIDGVLRVWNDEGKELARFAPAPAATAPLPASGGGAD